MPREVGRGRLSMGVTPYEVGDRIAYRCPRCGWAVLGGLMTRPDAIRRAFDARGTFRCVEEGCGGIMRRGRLRYA